MASTPQKSGTGRVGRWLLGILPTVLGAMLVLATQVGPEDATKNLRAWADLLGLEWPQGLTATRVFVILIVILVVYYGIFFHKQLRQIPRRSAAAYRAFRRPPAVAPEVEPLSPQEIVAINDVRASFRNAGAHASDRIVSLSQDVRGSDVKAVTFVWLLEKAERELREAKSRLEGAVDDRSPERLPAVRQALQEFIVAYAIVVRAVHDFEKEGVDLLGKRHADAYALWEQYHADWIQRLDTIKEQPALAHVRPAIQENLRTGADLRYSTLFARGRRLLESASPDQRAFLELFCTETTINPQNMIEYSIYSAGLQLGRNKILKLTEGESGAQRFCLPEPVRRGWTFHGSGPYPQRECVDIHPNSVRVQMNPSGGVPYIEQRPTSSD